MENSSTVLCCYRGNKVAPEPISLQPEAQQDPAESQPGPSGLGLELTTDPGSSGLKSELTDVSDPVDLAFKLTDVPGPSSVEMTLTTDPADPEPSSVSDPSSLKLTPDSDPTSTEPLPVPGPSSLEPVAPQDVDNPQPGSFFSLYDVGVALGSGNYGTVYEGTRRSDGQKVAIKFLTKSVQDCFTYIPGCKRPLLAEVALNLVVREPPRSPYIVQMYEWFEQHYRYILIMEYPHPCETLLSLTMRKGYLEEAVARGLMRQAVLAAKHCLDRGVFHCDIKPDNILVNTETMQLKLIDFGCGKLFKTSDCQEYKECPAVKATVRSLGALLFRMLNGICVVDMQMIPSSNLSSGFLRNWVCFKASEMLNVPSQSFPAAGSQQRVAPTGQSRNKVALKPGHSLLDWIRLTKSGRDLTGLRGRLIEVTEEELKKHNTRNDCWTCIRGLSVPPPLRQEPLPTPLPTKDHRPRYDWFQTDGTVNIVVYTKRKIPNAGCAVVDLQGDTLRVEMLLGKMSYLLYWRLSSEVQGHVDVLTAHSVGKVQVCLHKSVKDKWTKVGQPLEHHDTFIQCKDRGTDVVKPYTPVDQTLIPPSQSSAGMGSDLHLMMKIYLDGLLTSHLANLPIGSSLLVGGPEGSFTTRILRDVTHLYMLAAGTGFTPMARLIQLALQDLTSIRFEVEYVLSEPTDSWKGRRGRIDACMLQNFLERPENAKCLVCVCGPTGFTELAVQLVRQLNFSEEEVHIFQG
ncbi:cytochrome b5 reductase 4 [Labeo rohita]|uniref:non-specific serine/threonine protein kinase n=1 Tax=Labeo rohita TaxID=84645 RepID=A0A498LWL9_LABRO|nr:cytochrome b5 reductase 4 [Labeo rohita]